MWKDNIKKIKKYIKDQNVLVVNKTKLSLIIKLSESLKNSSNLI